MKSSLEARVDHDERYYLSSQWQLMWRKFQKHRVATVGGTVLLLLYLIAIFCEFFSVYDVSHRHGRNVHSPPVRIHLLDDQKRVFLRPFVYGLEQTMDPVTLRRVYAEDRDRIYPVKFFVHGDPYELWGLFKTDIHFMGTDGGVLFLFGSDALGRDLFSRVLYAMRTSLSIGLVGVLLSFVLGSLIGGVSGFYGGAVDTLIQRIIEFLICIPVIPLWMGLAAALPTDWPATKTYFAITIILAIIGWTRLARVVRGKLLSLRETDFVMAAKLCGVRQRAIILRHLLPSFMSYLIVSLTLSIPQMILGETALSFLGLGLQPPAVSLGVLLQEAQNLTTVAHHPWLLIPGLVVIAVVLCFNFLGDGLRDAADPYR